jgi:hypothetical protein
MIGDAVISRRDRGSVNWGRFLGLFATFFAFIGATAWVMQPRDPQLIAAFIPLVIATAYVVLGIFVGWRIAFTGITLGMLTLFGFFALPAIFMLWMAAIGGGALVLGGVWLLLTCPWTPPTRSSTNRCGCASWPRSMRWRARTRWITRLRAILGATDGNLGAHLATLEGAGYVTVEKDFVARKPRTRVAITAKGRNAFTRQVMYLRSLLDGPPIAQSAE